MPILSGQTLTVMQLNDAQRKLGITPFPVGGATGDVLVKASPANFDVAWSALLGGAILAGNGIVFAGNTVHFAQAAAYTTGAVPFASGAATIGFDAANLYWDNANNRLGIGTALPADRLHVTQDYTDATDTYLSRHNATVSVVGGFKRSFYSSFNTTGAATWNAGLISAGIFQGLHSGSGDVTGVFPRMFGVEVYHGKSASGTGDMNASIGLYVQAVNQNVTGTIDTTYDVFLPIAITTGAITNRRAIYQQDPAAHSYFAGNISVGTAAFHDNDMVRCERTFSTTGHPTGVAAILGFTAPANTAEFSAAGYFNNTSSGAIDFTSTNALMGCSGQSFHDGTGVCTGAAGVRGYAWKTNTGAITAAYGGRFGVFNSNAVGAIDSGTAVFIETPTVTGAITNYFAIRIQAGAGGTSYGIYQAGVNDINHFAGYSAFGPTGPVNTTFALFSESTAAISSQRILRGSAAYTGTVEGDLWNDFTQHCLTGYIAGVKQFDARVLFVQTADAVITNTNAETTMFGTGVGTLTLPANFFVVGKSLKITLRGKHTMDATPPTITFRVKLGGVTFASVAYTDLNDTDQYFELDFLLTCRTTGAGGTGIGQGYILMSEVSGGPPNIDFEQLVMTATAAMNTTGALALDVTAHPNAADAGSSLTITNALVEIKA